MRFPFGKKSKPEDEAEEAEEAILASEEATGSQIDDSVPYKALISYHEQLTPKEAVEVAKQQMVSLLKFPELCWYDVLPFENERTNGMLIEIHQLGTGKSHLSEIKKALLDSKIERAWFRTRNGRVNEVSLFQGMPQALVLSEENSRLRLDADPSDPDQSGIIEVNPTRKMKRAIKKGREPVWIGGVFFACSLAFMGYALSYQQRRADELGDVRKIQGRTLPHTQWNLVSRPPDGQFVSKLQFENNLWSRSLTAAPQAARPPSAQPGPNPAAAPNPAAPPLGIAPDIGPRAQPVPNLPAQPGGPVMPGFESRPGQAIQPPPALSPPTALPSQMPPVPPPPQTQPQQPGQPIPMAPAQPRPPAPTGAVNSAAPIPMAPVQMQPVQVRQIP